MIIKDPKEKKELDKIPDMDKNGDPIYKIDDEDLSEKKTKDLPDISRFKNRPQDLKDTTFQE